MTESMIEQVGEKLNEECRAIFGSSGYSYDVRNRLARAAIEAMREPTEEMEAAYMEVFTSARRLEPCEVYQAMIDAALIWPAGSADKAGVPMAKD